MKLIESAEVEIKREYTDEIKKSIVAFANTNDGVIYIGIDDNGDVVGIEDVDNTMLRLSNMIRDSIKPDVTMFVSYKVEKIEEKSIIKLMIQKGTSSPYYISSKGIRPEGIYLRQGASCAPATETAILRMIRETDGLKYENVRSLNQELTFNACHDEFESRNILFGISQMKSLKIITEEDIYTNLGLLLSDQCPHTIKIAVFEGTTKSIFKDRFEFNGSLLKQLNDSYDYIDKYNRTRSEFVGLHRKDMRDYPTESLRESILNALVHRDYTFSASTLISIFDDRIELVSIGGLVKGVNYEDIMLGVSITRNDKLANVFYRLELIEAYGTGIPKIFRSYEECRVKPKIETTDNAFRITLPNTNNINERLILSDNELVIMELIKMHKIIGRKVVEENLQISQTMANRLLRSLVDKKILITVGKGKNTQYRIYE